jgi:hypothetical protein
LLLLLLRAAIGSFSFAAIQQAIKNPARGGASEYLVGYTTVKLEKGLSQQSCRDKRFLDLR